MAWLDRNDPVVCPCGTHQRYEKVVKRLFKIVVATFCGLLLVALVVPLALSLAVSVPAVQNAIVQRFAKSASERLGARVSVERIALKGVNTIDIRGFYVEDHGGDTLLWVPRALAPVTGLGFAGGPLSFGRVRLSGAQLWLRKESVAHQMNISRMVDSIPDGNGRGRFRMRVEAIEADSLVFGLLRPYAKRRRAGVDFSRFVMRDARIRVRNFSIAGDTVKMDIDELSAAERTGWRVENLSARPLEISRGSVSLTDAEIRSEGSQLRLPRILLASPEGKWRHFSEFSDSVEMNVDMRSSKVTSALVGVFMPTVADWGVELDDVVLQTRGVLDALSGGVESARTRRTAFALDFTSRGMPHFERARFDVKLAKFNSTGSDVVALSESITGRRPTAASTAAIERLGELSIVGNFAGTVYDFGAAGDLKTDVGDVGVEMNVAGGDRLEGRLSTAGFELGRVLGSKERGVLAGVFAVSGSAEPGAPVGSIHGDIGALALRGHTYTGMEVDGRFEGRRFEVCLAARDPSLRADVTATIDRRERRLPRYTLDVDLQRADLTAIHPGGGDSLSVLSGRLEADFRGDGIDNVNGSVVLRDASYRSDGGEVLSQRATLEVRTGGAGKRISLNSEFVDGEIRSRTGYRDMARWLGGFLGRYIPLSGHKPPWTMPSPPDGSESAAAANYSIVSVSVKESEKLLAAILPTAAIAPGSKARFMFNPYTGAFSLSADSGFVEYGGVFAADLAMTADNSVDSLTVYLSGTDFYLGRSHIPRFELHGGAKGQTRLDVVLDDRKWRIAADSLGYADGRVGIDGLNIFSVDNPGQRLTATGTISHLASDTLHLRFNRFDLSPLGRLLPGEIGADFEGMATGWLDASSIRSTPRLDADIAISGVSAAGHRAPPLRFVSTPEAGGGVRYRLRNEASGGDLLSGTLSPRGVVDAVVSARGVDASLLDPLLGGVLEDTRGVASAHLTMGGTLGNLRADGYIDVSRLETTVGYTRARYSVSDARIDVDNSELLLPRTPVNSPLGGAGDISMRIDMADFRNIRTSVDAHADRMLAFDTGPDDSESFYGRVFATGSAAIRAGRMGTRIDISARTDAGTRFHLTPGAKSNVAWADFVVFADRSATPDTTDVVARKRGAYERRLAGRDGARRKKPLELNLTAGITPSAEVHMQIDPSLGPGITGRGEGVIDMRIDPASDRFTMTGDYNISSGRFELSMMEVFNKTFEIAPGSTLRWTGAPDDALLSLDASWRVRTSLGPLVAGGSLAGRMVPVEGIIRLRDRLSDPRITFDIALPSADADARLIAAGAMNTPELKSMQFLSLLTTGSFATDNSITGQSAGTGVMATGAVGFDILTNQLNNFLSSDYYDIFFRYRPQDNFAGTQLEAGFSTQLWNDRLEIEIEGNYVDDRARESIGTTSAKNLAGDVSLTWVIDRAGNLRLKVFSRTIDRLNETQGLQENGLGIYYRKDFDRVKIKNSNFGAKKVNR